MNFRDCVINCIAEGRVVQSFNRLNRVAITPELLGRLHMTERGQLLLTDLDESQQELLACFILFVHRHVWRKVKFAEARVTHAHSDPTMGINLSGLQQMPDSDADVLLS